MKKFLKDLEKELNKLGISEKEIKEIIGDHEEMIETALKDGLSEGQLADKFGNPAKVAKELHMDNVEAGFEIDESNEYSTPDELEGFELFNSFTTLDDEYNVAIKLVSENSSNKRAADDFSDEEIIERMMSSLCLEVIRCLEDNIVDSPESADMSLIWGIGFPPFRGGALRYVDSIGTQAFVEMVEKYSDLGGAYEVPKLLVDMAANDLKFFGGEA